MDKVLEKRLHLIEKLADLDDELAESILERDSMEKVTPQEVEQAIRRVTLQQVLYFHFTTSIIQIVNTNCYLTDRCTYFVR